MPKCYLYELWNGKEVVGHYSSLFPICGKHLVIWDQSILKQRYGVKPKEIKVPITVRIVHFDQIECLARVVLDVRRKSKRQIQILKGKR